MQKKIKFANFNHMKPTKRILVSDKAKNFQVSREAATSLFNELNNVDVELEFDFINVDFISRSYADQFYKAKMDWEKSHDAKAYIVNANEEVINMINVVSKTQNSTERFFENIPVYKFSKIDKLSDYLLSI